MQTEIIGFCRFSFFGPSDTKLDYSDRQVAFNNLYDAKRMETRFSLFENLFLPTIAAQTDPDYRLIVLSSACMPEAYRSRLAMLCATVPQIELVFSESEDLGKVIAKYTRVKEYRGKGLMQFRIDDDDALSRHYIAQLRDWAPRMRNEMIMTKPRGLMVYTGAGTADVAPMHRTLTGAGYAFYTEGPTRKNVLGFAHIKSGQRFAFISDPSVASFIQTFTTTTDTSFRAERKINKFLLDSGMVGKPEQRAKMVNAALEESFPMFTQQSLSQTFLNAEAAGTKTSSTNTIKLRKTA